MLSKRDRNRIIGLYYEEVKKLEQEDDSLNNLKSLYKELWFLCGPTWPCLCAYIKLLDIEAGLISPDDAFEAGKSYCTPDSTIGKAILAYMTEVENRPLTRELRAALTTNYNLLVQITGLSGLVTEFTHEYQRIYGPSGALKFFEYGFTLQRTAAERGAV